MPLIWIVTLAVVFGLAAMLLLIGVLTLDLLSLALAALLLWLGFRLRAQARARGPGAESDVSGQATLGAARDAPASADGESGADIDLDADADADVDATALELVVADGATSVSDEGVALHGSGRCLRRHATGEPVESATLDLDRDGARTLRVVTPPDQRDELQADDLAPGQPVALVPERAPGQAPRVRVFDDTVDHLAGWLAEPDAAAVAPLLLRGAGVRALSFYEWRDDDGRRCELSVLVYRPDALVEP